MKDQKRNSHQSVLHSGSATKDARDRRMYGGDFMDRRRFIKSITAVAMVASTSGVGVSAWAKELEAGSQKHKQGVLKLSSQEWLIPGKTIQEKAINLEKWAASGIELRGQGLAARVKNIKNELKGTSIKVSAICAGYEGVIISHEPAERKKAILSMKEILTAAGELGSTGLIVVPAFNNQTRLNNKEGRKILLDLLPELGEHAVKCGTRILLEPLNRQEAFFLRLLADAAAICRDVNHPGVAMMGDFYHMNIEETSDMGAFLSAGKYLHHVHLASAKRNLPGQDERSFIDGFRGLKMIGYQDYCSLECGIKGEPKVEIPKSFRFLQRQWEQAKIGEW